MSVDILRDSASTRSQHRRNLKGEGYNQGIWDINMLYTVSRSPYQSDLSYLLALVTPKDDILFLQDGVTAVIKDSEIFNNLLSQSKNLFVLKDDLSARGLNEKISEIVTVIDYAGFVDLTVKHHQHFAW
ncbi:sulfurtransferase complex subunit TusB [Candidatus Regiella insecticola]